jgi:hypothetical protein
LGAPLTVRPALKQLESTRKLAMMIDQLLATDILDRDLVGAIQRAFGGLEDVRTGRVSLRDARRWKIGEMDVRHLWVAQVKPTFHAAGCLAVLANGDQRAAVVAARQGEQVATAGPFAVEADWAESVVSVFGRFDAWTGARGAGLDGVGYSFFVDTGEAEWALQFNNPCSPQLRALEMGLFQAVQQLAPRDSDAVVQRFLDGWAYYLAGAERVGAATGQSDITREIERE